MPNPYLELQSPKPYFEPQPSSDNMNAPQTSNVEISDGSLTAENNIEDTITTTPPSFNEPLDASAGKDASIALGQDTGNDDTELINEENTDTTNPGVDTDTIDTPMKKGKRAIRWIRK